MALEGKVTVPKTWTDFEEKVNLLLKPFRGRKTTMRYEDILDVIDSISGEREVMESQEIIQVAFFATLVTLLAAS